MSKNVAPAAARRFSKTLLGDATKCPQCGSNNLDTSDYDGGKVMTCRVECSDCSLVWNEEYELTKAFNFQQE